jgi:HK97 family phage prohead protease
MSIETKSIILELKDFDKGKREAVIAHAAYNNIDRTKDISRKGMFNKSWVDNRDDIAFYKNHNSDLVPGKVTDFFEDDNLAYTKVFLGTHTLGEDTLKMLDEGIITKASFGYIPVKKNFIEVKGEKVRELKEVRWIETSVLTVLQANPLAKVQSVTKADDFDNDLIELKESISLMEKFCRNTGATDEAIKSILLEIEQAKHILSKYDTADTEAAKSLQQKASIEKDVDTINNFIKTLN